MTSTSMILAGAGIVIGFLLAIFATRNNSRPSLSPQTTDELRAGPANPQVMEVKRGEAGVTPLPPRDTSHDTPRDTPRINPLPPQVEPTKPQVVAFDGKRTIGLNYVIVQSYPDQKGAEEARDALAKAGISTTIEKGLRGLNPTWFTVVGTDGFARIRSADYEAAVKKIEQVSETFAKKKSFKAFTPMGYKWDKSDR